MRYIGNKEKLVERIDYILNSHDVKGDSVFDFFAGTANVGRYFKSKGLQIFSNDILYLSYCLQKAYIENNAEPSFSRLQDSLNLPNEGIFDPPLNKIVNYLNHIDGVEGFIYQNYTMEGTRNLERPRMYFSDENGKRIDAIRQQIENWRTDSLVNEAEYYILLACLIESVSFYSNVAGVYAAFYKKWDPRALKPFMLRAIRLYDNGKVNHVFNENSLDLVCDVAADVLYLDPPYNERQYLPNYHFVETIAKYDFPVIKGVTGMREYSREKSSFCNCKTALRDLDYISRNTPSPTVVLSYNSEGIMPKESIIEVLSAYGEVTVDEFEYLRFKSNSNGLSKTKRHVLEQVYILKK